MKPNINLKNRPLMTLTASLTVCASLMFLPTTAVKAQTISISTSCFSDAAVADLRAAATDVALGNNDPATAIARIKEAITILTNATVDCPGVFRAQIQQMIDNLNAAVASLSDISAVHPNASPAEDEEAAYVDVESTKTVTTMIKDDYYY